MSRKGVYQLLDKTGFQNIKIKADKQQPSFGKLFHHAKLGKLKFISDRIFGKNARVQVSIPLPGIYSITGQKAYYSQFYK